MHGAGQEVWEARPYSWGDCRAKRKAVPPLDKDFKVRLDDLRALSPR